MPDKMLMYCTIQIVFAIGHQGDVCLISVLFQIRHSARDLLHNISGSVAEAARSISTTVLDHFAGMEQDQHLFVNISRLHVSLSHRIQVVTKS
jgi:hypothetical protein